jgi:hypothetical protein
VPYILIGLLQVSIVLTLAQWCSACRCSADTTLYGSVLLFIAEPDARPDHMSVAQNQLQAMQMTFFFFLPSILLSGFMFPFRGMPHGRSTSGRRSRSRIFCASSAACCSKATAGAGPPEACPSRCYARGDRDRAPVLPQHA